jgi:hypothetical protein
MLIESSLNDLYKSTVVAFPKTKKRQHAIDEIKISKLEWIPFLGMNTLMIKALAQNESNGHEYNCVVLFKNVHYHDAMGPNLIEIVDLTKKHYFIEKLNYDDTQVLVRCSCEDFKWRGNYFDHLDRSLFGRKRKKYEALHNPGSANPTESPMVCKHLMKMSKTLTSILE